jgi:intergrase/recombinase
MEQKSKMQKIFRFFSFFAPEGGLQGTEASTKIRP